MIGFEISQARLYCRQILGERTRCAFADNKHTGNIAALFSHEILKALETLIMISEFRLN